MAQFQNPTNGARNSSATNTILGENAGRTAMTSTNCVIIGNLAGDAMTSGTDHVFIGKSAGGAMTTTTSSVFIGSQAGEDANGSGGLQSTFVGALAGSNVTSAQYNTGIGYLALGTGVGVGVGGPAYNTAVGWSALTNASSAQYNSCVGGQAGLAITTGARNACLGWNTASSVQTGNYNTAIGSTSTLAAGQNWGTGVSNNICINHGGAAADSGITRIGTWNVQTNAFLPTEVTVFDDNNSINAAQGKLTLRRSRNTGIVTSGDYLGEINFSGATASDTYTVGSIIRSVSSGTPAASRVASNLEFYTHPDSVTVSTQRMVISPTGAVTINAADSGTELTVTGEIDATTTIRGSTFYADGDAGGVASTTGLTNATSAASTGTNVVKATTGTGGKDSAGYIKMYVGATAVYVPYWTDPS